MTKKWPQLLLLLLVCTTSCEQKKKIPHARHILRLNLSDDPVSLDPRVVRSLKDLTLTKQLFEGLTRIDAEGNALPAIAEEILVTDDLLTYTFKLRDSFWCNGDPVTAYDFETSWNQALDPTFASDYSYMLYPIKNARLAREGKCQIDTVGVIALDEKTLVVQLEAPTPYFLELTAFPTYFPVHQQEMAFPEENTFVCNGPFQLKYWNAGSEIRLEKNQKYWDQNEVKLDEISFTIISDNLTESQLFEKNELDWLGQPISNSITTELISKIKEEGKLSSYPIAGTFWFKFNTEKEPFTSAKIRRAFSLAIDRNEIISHILRGNQTIATGPLPPSMSVSYSPYFEDADFKNAKKLFNEALIENKWSIESFPAVVLSYPPTERNSKIVQLVQQQWKKTLGIDVQLKAVENQVYKRNIRAGLFQIGTGDWIADFNDPLAFLDLFKYKKDGQTGNGMNDTGWYQSDFKKLLDKSLIEKDKVKRKKLLFEAEKLLVDEMPIAPVYHFSFDYVKKENVQNVVLSPLGIADFKYTEIR